LFNQAYELAPDNAEIRFQIGSVARLQGDLPLALQHMSYCLEKSPERPEVWLRLGEILSYSRRPDESVAVMQGAVQRHADTRAAWRKALFGGLTDGRTGERLAKRIAALPRAEHGPIS
tara:strand:+ start:2462 stop:2815 length:354 start_codon:yes stop_codon:yes gene_type:complete